MIEGKVCNYCSTFKSYNSFRKEKTCSDWYRGKCKDCERPMRHLHYINNKEKTNKLIKNFYLEIQAIKVSIISEKKNIIIKFLF